MTSQIPLFKITIVGPLPWGSGGHRKSKNPVNNHLCDIAVRVKRKITWDPKQETIVDDAEAAKMMHCELRAPWTL